MKQNEFSVFLYVILWCWGTSGYSASVVIPESIEVPGFGTVVLEQTIQKQNSTDIQEEDAEPIADLGESERENSDEILEHDTLAELEEEAVVAGKFQQSKIVLGPLEIVATLIELSSETGMLYVEGETALLGHKANFSFEFFPGDTSVCLALHFEQELLPGLCRFRNLYLIVAPPSIALEGDLVFSIPGVPKESSVRLSASIEKGENIEFSGVLQESLSFNNVVSLEKPSVTFSVNPLTLRLSAPTKILNHEVSALLSVSHDLLNKQKRAAGPIVTFSATIFDKKPLYPFKGIGVKALEDVEVKDVVIGFDSARKLFVFTGTSTILGISTTTQFMMSPDRITLEAFLAEDWKISNVVPGARGTILDDLGMTDARFVLTSKEYIHPQLRTVMRRGINLVGMIPIQKLLDRGLDSILHQEPPAEREQIKKKIQQFFPPIIPKRIAIFGSIGPSLPDIALSLSYEFDRQLLPPPFIELGAPLPAFLQTPTIKTYGDLPFPEVILQRMALRIIGDGPSVDMYGSIGVKPTPKDELLNCIGTLKIGPKTASLSASMLGTWKDPLGIASMLKLPKDKLQISNCAVEVGIDYGKFFKTGIPTVFGIIGEIKVGDAVARLGAKISSDVQDIALVGKLVKENPGSGDAEIITLKDIASFSRGIGIPLPELNIPNLGFKGEIRFAPKGSRVGEIIIEPGISLIGRLEILDKFADIGMSIGFDGLIARGSVSKLQLGPLLITGAGYDGKYGTSDDGPTVDLELTLKRQKCMVSGQIELLGDKSQTELLISTKGIQFFTETKLFRGKTKVKLVGDSVGSGKDIDFKVHGEFQDDFRDFLEKEILKLLDNVTRQVTQEIAKAQQDMKVAEDKLTEAQRKVDNLNRSIDQKKKEFDGASVKGWPWQVAKGLAIRAKLGAEIAGLWVAHKAAIGAFEIAKVTVKTTRENFKIAEKGVGLAGTIGKDILKGVRDGFKVRRVTIDFSMKKIFPPSSKLPMVTFDAVILGKELVNQKVQFNLNQPDKLVQDVFAIIKRVFSK